MTTTVKASNDLPEVASAERFLAAFRSVETELRTRADDAGELPVGKARLDANDLISFARRTAMLSPDASTFLHRCRDARNAYVHVSFDEYEGPVTLPPVAVVHRLERILAALRNPARARAVAPKATICAPESQVREVLALMRAHDFSQVPFRDRDGHWRLFTRDSVAQWVESSTDDDNACLLDLRTSIAALAEDDSIRCPSPVKAPPESEVSLLITLLERTLTTPDDQPNGYPAVLVVDEVSLNARIFTPDDLPAAYDLLGR